MALPSHTPPLPQSPGIYDEMSQFVHRLALAIVDLHLHTSLISLEANESRWERIQKLPYCSPEKKANQLSKAIYECLEQLHAIFEGYALPEELQASVQEMVSLRKMRTLGQGAHKLHRENLEESVRKVATETLQLVTRLTAVALKATEEVVDLERTDNPEENEAIVMNWMKGVSNKFQNLLGDPI